MRYLSFDIEATGLEESDLMIEFAIVPFCTESRSIEKSLHFHSFIKCPSFEELRPKLSDWVIQNNKELITRANEKGVLLSKFKETFTRYLESPDLKNYFKDQEKFTLFGKSMSAIDLPFLNRDLGWDFMRKYFEHRQLDLSSVAYNFIDMNIIPKKCTSGSFLMNYLNMGEVCHTALDDAIHTAQMYLILIEKYENIVND